MDINKAEPGIYQAMFAADNAVQGFDIDPKLKELIKVRVSQINGCGYCINYHTKDALDLSETNQRLFALSAWWETPFFSEAEQAALKLAEEVTRTKAGPIDIYCHHYQQLEPHRHTGAYGSGARLNTPTIRIF